VGDPHGPGMAALWTGMDASGQTPASPSIDQVIASKLGAQTRHATIYLRTQRAAGRSARQPNGARQQLQSIRNGLDTLNKNIGTTGMGVLQNCKQPTISGGATYPAIVMDTIDLLVMVTACDLSRVMSLQFWRALSPLVPDWLNITTDHHSLSHQAPHRFQLGPNDSLDRGRTSALIAARTGRRSRRTSCVLPSSPSTASSRLPSSRRSPRRRAPAVLRRVRAHPLSLPLHTLVASPLAVGHSLISLRSGDPSTPLTSLGRPR
jgi:hypothetical protein